jgi:Holliday junction resolvasome RuvABC endonuclease subunit
MKVLGIHIATNQLRYAVLDGTRAVPRLVDKDRLSTPDPANVAALMDWFESQFIRLLDQHTPDRIACRLTLSPKKNQLFTSCFPFGVLYLLAHHRNIPVVPYVSGNYVASRLNLPKGTNIYAHCDQVLGVHPPYWDDNQKHAILAAWFELE